MAAKAPAPASSSSATFEPICFCWAHLMCRSKGSMAARGRTRLRPILSVTSILFGSNFAEENLTKSSPTESASEDSTNVIKTLRRSSSSPAAFSMTRSLNPTTSSSGSRSAFDNAKIQIRGNLTSGLPSTSNSFLRFNKPLRKLVNKYFRYRSSSPALSINRCPSTSKKATSEPSSALNVSTLRCACSPLTSSSHHSPG